MVQFYFKRIIEKIRFNFIPVYDIEDDSIYGYKIIKDFNSIGFNDKDIMYQMAFEEDIFEILVLKLLEKSYQMAIEKGYINKKLFYTLRLNYVLDKSIFMERIYTLVSALQIPQENLVFDLKGIDDWNKFYKETENCSLKYLKLYKEERKCAFNLNAITGSSAELVEIRNIENLTVFKEYIDKDVKLIFNQNSNPNLTKEDLKKLGIRYYYFFNRDADNQKEEQ